MMVKAEAQLSIQFPDFSFYLLVKWRACYNRQVMLTTEHLITLSLVSISVYLNILDLSVF